MAGKNRRMSEDQKVALRQLASDISRGNRAVRIAMGRAVNSPPKTERTVGFYLLGHENEFELCFRKLASLMLDKTTWTSAAEDKYIYEIFPQWFNASRLKQYPPAFMELFSDISAIKVSAGEAADLRKVVKARFRKLFLPAMRSVESAFAAKGEPLLCLNTCDGDTIIFLHTTPEVAERWRDVQLGETWEGSPLGISSPPWAWFWDQISYATGLKLGKAPRGGEVRYKRTIADLRF